MSRVFHHPLQNCPCNCKCAQFSSVQQQDLIIFHRTINNTTIHNWILRNSKTLVFLKVVKNEESKLNCPKTPSNNLPFNGNGINRRLEWADPHYVHRAVTPDRTKILVHCPTYKKKGHPTLKLKKKNLSSFFRPLQPTSTRSSSARASPRP